MAKVLMLSDRQADLVGSIVDWWLEGMNDAMDETIADANTLDTMDKMLDSCDGLNDQVILLRDVQEQLKKVVADDDA
jgi:hypothetical protein